MCVQLVPSRVFFSYKIFSPSQPLEKYFPHPNLLKYVFPIPTSWKIFSPSQPLENSLRGIYFHSKNYHLPRVVCRKNGTSKDYLFVLLGYFYTKNHLCSPKRHICKKSAQKRPWKLRSVQTYLDIEKNHIWKLSKNFCNVVYILYNIRIYY